MPSTLPIMSAGFSTSGTPNFFIWAVNPSIRSGDSFDSPAHPTTTCAPSPRSPSAVPSPGSRPAEQKPETAEHLERGEVSADHGLVRGDALARGRGDQSVRRERRPQPATDGFLLTRRRVDEEHAVAVGLREAPGEPLIRHYEFAL